MKFPALFLLAAVLLLFPAAPLLHAGRPATDGELIERYTAHRQEFQQLAALLSAQRGNVFGPRYGEWARLKDEVGIKTFQGTGGQNRLGLRFPAVLRTDLFQFTRGATRGYAWLPNPPALLEAESDRVHRQRGEPPTLFVYTDPRRPLPPSPPRRRPRPIRHRPPPPRRPLVSVCRQRPFSRRVVTGRFAE